MATSPGGKTLTVNLHKLLPCHLRRFIRVFVVDIVARVDASLRLLLRCFSLLADKIAKPRDSVSTDNSG